MAQTNRVSDVDVLIAGAGPVGLLASILLTRMGISHRLIERELNESPLTRALGLHARTMEMFAIIGLLDQFLEAGDRVRELNAYIHGKLALQLTRLDKLESTYNFALFIDQVRTGKILNDELMRLNRKVERGWELHDTEVNDDQDVVVTKIRRALDGNNTRTTESKVTGWLEPGEEEEGKQYEYETVRSKFLIAADGGRSVVRHKLNIPFSGRTLTNRMILYDGLVDTSVKLKQMNFIVGGNKRTFGVFPLSDNRVRVIFADGLIDPSKPDTGVPSLEEFKRLASETAAPLKFDIKTVEWLTYYRVNERVADNFWHKGRIFLVGDACHVHSPSGGQGLNTGLQDAFNLSWKIALVTKGLAKPDILATYEHERRPIAKSIVALSAQTFQYMFPRTWFARVVRDIVFRTAPHIIPLMPATSNQSRVSMLSHRYHDNVLNQKHPTQTAPSEDFTVGTRARDGPLRTLTADDREEQKTFKLHDLLGGPGVFHIVVFAADKLQNVKVAKQLSHDAAVYLSRWRKRWQLVPHKPMFQMHILAAKTDSLMADDMIKDCLRQSFLNKQKGDARLYADNDGLVHSRYGLSTSLGAGAIVVLRPDSYIGFRVLGTTNMAFDDVEAYFTSFLI
ncbi:hypothetical protein DFQ27_009908 [Actinomortierella ambigua]|uniref:FAD-binding domain-containing protein n=1 Tax=Actinomortierella ambigua TaxID=1343610 RepID=A0A9P6PMS0_9FUNG|nr:hypothetical protein DFQ27_009908 [Actinomortierella ambigua]